MNDEYAGWLAEYSAIGSCEHWHRTGGHEREKCPVNEATCDYVKAQVESGKVQSALVARYAGELAASAYRELELIRELEKAESGGPDCE